jgi:hypothetical protein
MESVSEDGADRETYNKISWQGFPSKDGRGFRDFYHNWTNSILQQVKRKFGK